LAEERNDSTHSLSETHLTKLFEWEPRMDEPVQSLAEANENVPDTEPGAHQDCRGALDRFDEQFHMVVAGTELSMANAHYRIRASTGEIFEGVTDSRGFTERIRTPTSADLTIEIFDVDNEETIGDHV
jgi:hypothetical protein